jgi:integrase
MVEGFKRNLERRYEPATINRALGTVKHMLRMNGSQAAVAIKNMQVSQHEVTAITEDEERQILQILRNGRDRFVGMRNCAIFSTLLATGMRISEALSIRVEQISWTNSCFTRVRCKGDKYRDVQFPESLREDLAPYLALREQELAERIGPRNHDKYALFLTLYNFHNDPDSGFVESVSARKFFIHVSKIIGRRVHAHLCRHTLAFGIYGDSGNAREVQLTLGHSSLKTTERYLPKNKSIVRGAITRVAERRKAVK